MRACSVTCDAVVEGAGVVEVLASQEGGSALKVSLLIFFFPGDSKYLLCLNQWFLREKQWFWWSANCGLF